MQGYNYPTYGQIVQPIQQIQRPETGARCFFVDNVSDIDNIKPDLNVILIGINTRNGEIYTRKWGTDGLVHTDTFIRKKDESVSILDRLNLLEQRLEKLNADHTGTVEQTVNNAEQQRDANVQSDDERKIS